MDMSNYTMPSTLTPFAGQEAELLRGGKEWMPMVHFHMTSPFHIYLI